MPSRISFKNFKPFGDNLQAIPMKPIVLVYGPNSTGKSSLIEAMLYYHHLDLAYLEEIGNEEYLNVKNPYFAGDRLDLNGFSNIVYAKDTSREIAFESIYDNKDIERYIPNLKKFRRLISDIVNEECFFDEDNLYQYLCDKLSNLVGSKSVLNGDKGKIYKEYVQNTVNEYQENDDKEVDVWIDIIDVYLLHIDRYFNCIFCRNSSPVKIEELAYNIKDYIDHMLNVSSIGNIKIVRKVGLNIHAKYYSVIELFIDEDILFSCKYIGENLEYTIYNHYVLKPIIYIFNRKYEKYKFDKDGKIVVKTTRLKVLFLKEKDFLLNYILEIESNIFNPKYSYEMQYIGPLRLVPTKNDLFNKVNEQIKRNTYSMKKKHYTYRTKLIRGIGNKIKFLQFNAFPFEKIKNNIQVFKEKQNIKDLFLIGLNSILFLFNKVFEILVISLMSIFYVVFNMPVRIEERWHKVKVKFTFLFPKTSQFSTIGAVRTEKMWLDFVGSKSIQDEINEWLGSTKLRSHYKVKVDTVRQKFIRRFFNIGEKKQLSFLDMKTNTQVFPNEMGTGISQVLPILISLKIRKNSMLFVEQPELHLHPALQSELADEFILSINKHKNTCMVETHSEHLLLRFMKRMKQTYEGTIEDENLRLTPDDIALLYVDTDGENTYILELELDEDGTLLDPWPGGFFEEGFNERFF